MPRSPSLAQRLQESETLLEIGLELAEKLDLGAVLTLALEKAESFCRAETSSIWELDSDRKELFFRVVRGRAATEIRGLRVPLGQGIVGAVAATGVAELVNDVAKDARWRGDASERFDTRAILAVPLSVRGRVIGVLQLLNPIDADGFTAEDLRRMRLFAGPLAQAIENARLYTEQKRLFLDTVTALAEAVEKRDPYTGGHVRRVVAYSVLLGEKLGLAHAELESLRVAAALHDIGKIAIPDHVLRKPAPLDAEENAIMRKHPVDGAEIVSRVHRLREVLPGVRSHHERLDGRGYPDGLADEAIPLVARIIAVADTYDAMTTSRPYRAALSAETAESEIRKVAGSHLCPRVVAAFEELYRSGSFRLAAGEALLRSLSAETGREYNPADSDED